MTKARGSRQFGSGQVGGRFTAAMRTYRAMPRAVRWGVLFALGLGVYFGAVEPIIGFTQGIFDQADRNHYSIQDAVKRAEQREAADSQMATGVARFGEVHLPAEQSARSKELTDRIDAVMKSRGVSDWRLSTRRPTPLGRDVLSTVLSPTQEVQRLVFEVTIEGPPDVVMGVLGDLEKSPEVVSIGEVTLRTIEDKKRVNAVLLPETWIIAEKGARR